MVCVVLATALGLVAVPGTVSAEPTDRQLGAAQQAVETAAAGVSRMLIRIGETQMAVAAAQADAAVARQAYERELANSRAAEEAARDAQAAVQRAQQELAGARADVAAFVRTSYMGGSTSPVVRALLTSGGPAHALERTALLEAVGRGRADVLGRMEAVGRQAADASRAARATLARATMSGARAADELAMARQIEADARQDAATFVAQRAALEAQLQEVRTALVALQAQRPATRPPAPGPGRRPLPRRADRRRGTTGTPSRCASPAATGASTPATVTTAGCSSARPPGCPSVAAPTPRGPTWPRRPSRSPSRRRSWRSRARARGRRAAGVSDRAQVSRAPTG